ncbi:MAG: hypothetical protein J0L55_08260 [Caulobacterales bacterium]|nr:hypothetical protein [Caulobacterales bacterium]MCA0373286.1 hypothetical protein [Pseudomonadota bacterium]
MANKFSPSDAAVSIFTFAKLNPKFTIKFMAISAILSLIFTIMLSFTGIMEFSAAVEKLNPNSTDLEPFYNALKLINTPVTFGFFITAILVSGILSAMALRKLVRNQETGFYGLSFGNDEKNIIFGNLIIALIIFGVIFAISFVISFVAVFFPPIAFLFPVFAILGVIFLIGRLGIWAVISIANHTIGIKETYKYTKEQFWSFVGAYILCVTLFIIASIFVKALLSFLFSAIMPAGTFYKAPANGNEILTIGTLLFQFIFSFLSSFGSLALLCVGAYAYHQIEAGEVKEQVQ